VQVIIKNLHTTLSRLIFVKKLFLGEKKTEALPPAAKAVAKSQRMLEFPVSSGNAHRTKVK